MQGRRLQLDADGHIADARIQPGDYWFWDGAWSAKTPNGYRCGLRNHSVVEHEDGTITVSPSILVSTSEDGISKEVWHGFLEHGIWRQC